MEYKRKTLSNDDIQNLEKQKIEQIDSIVEVYKEKFASLNLDLVNKYVYMSSQDDNYKDLDLEKERNYSSEYICQARITIEKHKETKEESSEENQEQIESTEETLEQEVEESSEEIRGDESFEETKAKPDDALAFTDVMVLRVYKSFFTEFVSLLDDFEQLKLDLEEFYNHFLSESENE